MELGIAWPPGFCRFVHLLLLLQDLKHQEFRAKLEKKLEAETSQKELMESKLADTIQALEATQKQLAQKGWEAANALAAMNDEMVRQRSTSDERQKVLEDETILLRRKVEDLLAKQSEGPPRQDFEAQLQRKVQELQEQSVYIKQLEDSARLAATEVARAATATKMVSEEEREKFADLRSKLWAREDELVSVRSELEAFKKDALLVESRHEEQLAKQKQLEEERDALSVKLDQCQKDTQEATQLEVDTLERCEEEQLLVVKHEKEQFHQQLQGVASDLTATLKELETKSVTGQCPRELGATKRALTHLQEQITSVCEELLLERPMARKKKAGQQKSRGSAEHSSTAFQVLSIEHEELQSKHEQLQHVPVGLEKFWVDVAYRYKPLHAVTILGLMRPVNQVVLSLDVFPFDDA